MTELKETAITWLGRVSADFDVVPSSLVFRERNEVDRSNDVHLTPSQKFGVVTQAKYQELAGGKVVQKLSNAPMKHVEPGDFVIHLRSFQGGIELSEIRGKVSTAYTVLSPVRSNESRYWRYFLKSAPFISGLASSTDQLRDGQTINYSRFSRLKLLRPPLYVQRRIADYLDEKVHEMDAQVALLEDLVKNLNSRSILFRNSKILNNPYGAERKLWSLVLKKDEVSESKEYVALEDMESWTGVAKTRQAESRVTGIAYSPGDVLFGKLRPYLAKVYRAESSGVAVGDVHVYKANPEIDSRFLKHLLLTTDFVGYAEMNSTGVKMPRIEWPKISQFRVRVPTLPMQREIADELDRGTVEMDFLIKEAKDLIENLKARKTALITEVVTGRKKV